MARMNKLLGGRPRLDLEMAHILEAVRRHRQVIAPARELGCCDAYIHVRLKHVGLTLRESLVARLQSHAYETGLHRDARFFIVNRHRVWQIVDAAADLAGLVKPPGVGTAHVLRHSGAIERMRLSGILGASRISWAMPARP